MMAGQLRASAALALTQCTSPRKAHARSFSAFNPLGSSSSSYPPLFSSSASCYESASGRFKIETCSSRSGGKLRSPFWDGESAFRREAGVDMLWWAAAAIPPRDSKRRGGVARAAGAAGAGMRRTSRGVTPTKPGQFLLIFIAVAYMTILVIIPFINVFVQAFSNGVQPFIQNLLDPDFQHAVKMTCTVAAIVVPLNTAFGIIIAIWVTRYEFPFKAFLMTCLDLPFSISPVVVGLMLMLLYGRQGLFAPFLRRWNIEIVFALPGMILATCFVTIPFVVREVIPSLLEMDPFEEEAARTMGANDWEVFCQVTFPNIRLGLFYGITLCNARAMGEFGAVSVISGNIVGKTQTLTLFVESAYKEYNTQGAFSAALLLSVLALITLFMKTKLEGERAKQLSFR